MLFIRNQKELYCQVCLHTQGICFGAEASSAHSNTNYNLKKN